MIVHEKEKLYRRIQRTSYKKVNNVKDIGIVARKHKNARSTVHRVG